MHEPKLHRLVMPAGTNILLVKVGTDEYPALQEELENVMADLVLAEGESVRTVITPHRIQMEELPKIDDGEAYWISIGSEYCPYSDDLMQREKETLKVLGDYKPDVYHYPDRVMVVTNHTVKVGKISLSNRTFIALK